MKIIFRLLTLLVVIAMLVGCLASCELIDSITGSSNTENPDNGEDNGNENQGAEPNPDGDTSGGTAGGNPDENPDENPDGKPDEKPDETPEFVDYASQLKFDAGSGRAHTEVTVESYIDGDTTHFKVPNDVVASGYLKARYLGINTPESTGIIEPWGKKASNYTKNQLKQAISIIIESDNATWNLDSTGERYLVWVWYKTAEGEDYRNLNLEILQQGLAFGSNVSSNAYSETALNILAQAKMLKLHVFSSESDPDFYYGGATELTLKEIKANCEKYEGKLVKFEATVAKRSGVTVYVEEFDPVNNMYFGMQIFCGYSFPMSLFKVGNRVSVVGTLQYYENGGTYQISNLKYDDLDPNWEGGCRVLGKGYEASYGELDVNTLMNGEIELDVFVEQKDENGEVVDETLEKQKFDYGELAHYSTATVKNLIVKSVYTTVSTTDSNGALTITCETADGIEIKVRTAKQLIKEVDGAEIAVVNSDFPAGTVISVKGIIDSFQGEYQIKVFSFDDITFEQN